MSAIQSTATDQAAIPGRRKVAKPASRRKVDAAEKHEKGSWYVSPEGRKRLAIHAIMSGMSQSDYLDMLLRGLNHYAMPAVNSKAPRLAPSLPADSTLPVGEDRPEAAA